MELLISFFIVFFTLIIYAFVGYPMNFPELGIILEIGIFGFFILKRIDNK